MEIHPGPVSEQDRQRPGLGLWQRQLQALHTGKGNWRWHGPQRTEGESQKCWMMPRKEGFLEEAAFRKGLRDSGILLVGMSEAEGPSMSICLAEKLKNEVLGRWLSQEVLAVWKPELSRLQQAWV